MLMHARKTTSWRPMRPSYDLSVQAGQLDVLPAPPSVRLADEGTALASKDRDEPLSQRTSTLPRIEQYFAAIPVGIAETEDADAAVIQVWEGTVLEIDSVRRSMRVQLHAKIGDIPDHVGEIDLEWVADQDLDLVAPGAVFYLTLFKKRRRGGTIQNSQELRFRRRPAWTRQQLGKIVEIAEQLRTKLRPGQLATD